ncbi:hypothetical protein CY0110_16082 [Crocosphaera chwakensis CCY0110]|uniref:Uncharacterized protein n=1 Tax=Crocosphaera chwakensis CCY0110 TaxID=391612 RepID=A3IHP8_9CHRO|nr:hypothetical protein CY0110_16082 [Crocosphaera chwakensis CCY0110]
MVLPYEIDRFDVHLTIHYME